jgi:hypothetical protein
MGLKLLTKLGSNKLKYYRLIGSNIFYFLLTRDAIYQTEMFLKVHYSISPMNHFIKNNISNKFNI